MSQKLRTKVATTADRLQLKLFNYDILLAEGHSCENQKMNFDKRIAARSQPVLKKGDDVWITDRREFAIVSQELRNGNFRRNRCHLRKLHKKKKCQHYESRPVADNLPVTDSQPTPTLDVRGNKTTRCGRKVGKQGRFNRLIVRCYILFIHLDKDKEINNMAK